MTPRPRQEVFDVLIVGLGAFGSAAAHYLARSGASVCGFDRWQPPHDQGSSHGASRIIREAYSEDPLYVPPLRRSYELWTELERASQRHLLTACGGLMLGRPEAELVEGARMSAGDHGLDCAVLSQREILDRWPGTFAPDSDTVAVLDPRAGVLAPEACIETFLEGAASGGATLRCGSEVVGWEANGDGVRVELADGSHSTGRKLLLAAGAWMGDLVPALADHLRVARQVMHWFDVAGDGDRMRPERFPIFVWEHDSPRIFYGFPDSGDGLKVAVHHDGELTTATTVNRDVSVAEVDAVRALVDHLLPGVAGAWLRSAVCMYTNTVDGHFIVDRHPEHSDVLLASPCSGHGFKFAPAVGEALADLLQDREPRFSLDAFGLDRFTDPSRRLTRVRTGAARFQGDVREA